ncbi:hypothetical protein SUGI_0472060 [Cryptomeria japonica]|uniref:36.4 kDa proline-rich protein-like n=1 Tax=Cryptomeria japonica TaxID=3369 RepID=UPI002408B713|nr:36.4 kDa proline-rich protein-like [Cryptomeria japonica]GLJ24682.1 hypothetical protein SUGI_0472060 [Cryptomeria japonica]
MKKTVAVLLIVMIEVATSMRVLMAWNPVPQPPPAPAPAPAKCPLDALKLGACVEVLSGLVHIGIGDPIVNQCCPVIEGVLALEVALCLCTAIRAKLLNLNILVPVALQLIASCGMTPPPGFKCPDQ